MPLQCEYVRALLPGKWALLLLVAISSVHGQTFDSKSLPSATAEHLVELNYLSNVTPWLLVQPVMQWFIKPQGDASRENVFVVGFRTKVTF